MKTTKESRAKLREDTNCHGCTVDILALLDDLDATVSEAARLTVVLDAPGNWDTTQRLAEVVRFVRELAEK